MPFFNVSVRAIHIVLAKLHHGQRQVVLVVVGIAGDGAAKNFGGSRGVAQVRVDVSEQGEVCVVLLRGSGDLLRAGQRLLVFAACVAAQSPD